MTDQQAIIENIRDRGQSYADITKDRGQSYVDIMKDEDPNNINDSVGRKRATDWL